MKRHFWLNGGIFSISRVITNGIAEVILHPRSSLMMVMMITMTITITMMIMMTMTIRKPVEILPTEDFAVPTEAFLVQNKP